MTVAVALIVLVSIGASVVLVWPAARRSSLGPWHPAVAWLGLHLVFFGLGSAVLALDGRTGPALYVAGAALTFALAVALSDWVADRRSDRPTADGAVAAVEAAPLRPAAVGALAGLGFVLVLPTLARVGLPFLVEDITGARAELAGPALQVFRVAVPALGLALVLREPRRLAAWLLVSGLLMLEIALASRYLAAELLAIGVVGIGLAGWRIQPRLVVAGALAGVIAFGGIQVLRAYDQAAGRELAFAVERTVNRVILIQPRTLEALQAVIPAEQPHYDGLTWLRRLGPTLGRPDIPNLGYWIYPRLFPDQETPGYAAPGLVGEAWANFGVLGLALFGLLGVVAERLGAFAGRRRHATGDLIAGALAIVFVARTHALGVNGLTLLLAVVVVWRALAAAGLTGTAAVLRDTLRGRT
ncbi:MAG: hypothetical protein ACSLFN_00805 [Candidatus Limnocylindrales bacterium]